MTTWWRRGARVMVVGYYGADNAGDDLILSALLDRLPVAPIVCSLFPARVTAQHAVDAVALDDPAAVEAALDRSDVLVIGGGGLLQDHHLEGRSWPSMKDLAWGPGLYARLGVEALARGVTLTLAGLGVGPLSTAAGRGCARFLAEQAALVSVRDRASAALLREAGYVGETHVGGDLALLAPELGAMGSGERAHITVSARAWRAAPDGYAQRLASALDQAAEALGLPVVFAGLDRRDDVDPGFHREIAASLRADHHNADGGTASLLAAIARARVVLGMRLHASILAHASGVPAVGLAYDEKVAAHYEEVGERARVLGLDAAPEDVAASLIEAARGGLSAAAAGHVARLRAGAEGTVSRLAALLRGARRRRRTASEADRVALGEHLDALAG